MRYILKPIQAHKETRILLAHRGQGHLDLMQWAKGRPRRVLIKTVVRLKFKLMSLVTL